MRKTGQKYFTVTLLAGLLLPLTNHVFAASPAPGFELQSLDGKSVSLPSILRENKLLVLSFFGTWCDSCQKEIGDLPEMIKGRNVAVYLVGVDGDKDKIERFVAKHKIDFPVLWDPKAKNLGRKYDLMRGAFVLVPKTVIISPAGNIEYTSESYSEKQKAALADKIAQLSAKQWEHNNDIAIFFTGSINGYLESCNCYKHPYGGLIKLLSLHKQQAANYPHSLLLDSGDFLPYGVTATQATPVFKAMAAAGYDAIAVGDQDLAFKDFEPLALKEKLPILASNVRMNAKAPGIADKTFPAGNIKLRVVSWATPETYALYPEAFTQALQFSTFKDLLRTGKNADVLVVLAHAGLDECRRLATEFPEIDIIVAGHSQELTKQAVKVGDTYIVQSGGNVQNMGRIVLNLTEKKKLLVKSYENYALTNDIPNSPAIEEILKPKGVN